MSKSEQLSEYFGATPSAARSGALRRASGAYSLSRLGSDPALRLFDDIEAFRLVRSAAPRADGAPVPSAETLVEAKIIVARNLYLRGEEQVTSVLVEEELDRLHRFRSLYSETLLFRGRSVVFAASDDTLRDGRHQFGRPANRVMLARDAARFYFFRGSERETPVGDEADMEDLLRHQDRLTFVFEGHGRDNALKLPRALRVRRLASLLSSRRADLAPPIVIIDACRAHDFARKLLAEMQHRGTEAALPVVIVPDEYGQSLIKDVFGGAFLRRHLAPGNGGSTIGTALRSRSRRLSVYAPDDHGVPMQIG